MKHKIIFILLIFLFTGCYNYRELNELERVADIIEEKIKERK